MKIILFFCIATWTINSGLCATEATLICRRQANIFISSETGKEFLPGRTNNLNFVKQISFTFFRVNQLSGIPAVVIKSSVTGNPFGYMHEYEEFSERF